MQHLASANGVNITNHLLPEKTFASVLLAFFFTLGVPGNIVVMVKLAGWLKKDSFTPRLMMSLAVSDFLTLFPLPLWIQAFLYGWTFGSFLCKFLSYVLYLNLYCSTLCVILMSVQRYMQVQHPQKWSKLGRKGQKSLLCGMWMLSGLLTSYAPVQRDVHLGNDGQQQCSLRYRNDEERVATLLWEIFLFFMSFLMLACFYFRLYLRVSQTAFCNSTIMVKLVKNIVLTFFICWVPYVIVDVVLVIALLHKNNIMFQFAETVDNITGALAFINSCANPFLYAFSAMGSWQRTSSENS